MYQIFVSLAALSLAVGGQSHTLPPHAARIGPIILPTGEESLRLKRDAYDLTSLADGVKFDLDADGVEEYTAWTCAGSNIGFLAYDRNGNGRIDNGKELFGNFTHPGKGNGFAALLQDAGLVGNLEAGNPLYDKLVLWTDRNHNGLSEPHELRPFKELYTSIGLSYEVSEKRDAHGNRFLYRGGATMRTASGPNRQKNKAEDLARHVEVYDVFFIVQK